LRELEVSVNTFLNGQIELFIERGYRPKAIKGQPGLFLLTDKEAKLFEEPTGFLYDQFVNAGSSPSVHTWEKAAYGLKTWFQYCQALKKDWRSVTSIDRTDFRDDFEASISPHTGELYGPKGIRDTMVVVRQFYAYAARKRWYFGDIGTGDDVFDDIETGNRGADEDALAHTRTARTRLRDRELPKVSRNQKIRCLRIDDLRALLNYVGPQATRRKGDMRNCRDRLIVDIGVYVGLRVREMARLTTLQFLNLNPDPAAPYVDLELTIVGKGDVVRQVAVPTWLVLDAIEYIDTERKQALANRKKSSRGIPTQLFLGHLNSNNGEGVPITRGAIQKMVERACLAIGLVDTEEKTDPDTGEKYLQKVARYSIHDLRHTYAVYTYHIEVKNKNLEPWKKIQAQLGHARLKTTINTYLAHVQIFSSQPGLFSLHRSLGLA
jgi:integrase